MNGFAAVLVLLGVFWTQTCALETFFLPEPDNIAVIVTIDNDRHVVYVHVRSGLYSSDTVIDYLRGYIATRLFSRTACYIMKINKEYIPDLQEIRRLALERQTMHTPYSPKNLWLQFQSGRSMRGTYEDWLIYGEHIQQLCRGLPLHQLAITEPLPNVHGYASAGIPSILGFKIFKKLN